MSAPNYGVQTTDSFSNMISRIGLNGTNNLSQGTYGRGTLTSNSQLLESMYETSWVTGAVVDAVAEDMTRAGVTISGVDDPEQVEGLHYTLAQTGVWNALTEAIKWARLYGGSLAVLMVNGQDLSTALDVTTVGADGFGGLCVLDRHQVTPSINDLITTGVEAGLPRTYTVLENSALKAGQVIHHTRVIRFMGVQLPRRRAISQMYWGDSVIQRLHDRLVSFDNTTLGAANLVNRAYLRTISVEGLREAIASGQQEPIINMFKLVQVLQDNAGITLLDKKDVFSTAAYSFAGLDAVLMQFGQQLSGAAGIPLTRLFGQSPAGMNATGESDMRMYYDNINTQQESRMRAGIERILQMVWRSKFGVPPPEGMTFLFTSLWQMSDTEKAVNAKTIADTIVAYVTNDIMDRPTAMREARASSGATGIGSNISDEAIDEAEEEPPAPLPSELDPDPLADPEAVPTNVVRMRAVDRMMVRLGMKK